MEQEIRKKLFELQDLKYKEFNSDLCPNVDNIIGVRIPILRKFAKELYKNNKLDEIKIGNKYYVQMANAWAISECLANYYKKTILFLKSCILDKFTYNKAIQKAIESYRIEDIQKEELRKMKI